MNIEEFLLKFLDGGPIGIPLNRNDTSIVHETDIPATVVPRVGIPAGAPFWVTVTVIQLGLLATLKLL